MAKKKISHSANSQESKHSQNETQTMSMPTLTDDSYLQQIQSLRNLNAKLLKETAERRQQIDSLQSELHHSAVSNNDMLAAFHIEKVVTSVVVDSHVKGMNLLFDTLLGEKDREVERLQRERKSLDLRFQNETKLVEESLKREGKLREEVEKLRLEGENVLLQKQRDVSELKMERDSALKSSRESFEAVETLKEEIEALRRGKDEFVKREGKLREEAEKLRLEGENLLLQKQRDISELKMERDSALKSSRESFDAVETLKEEIEALRIGKDEFVKISKNQKQKIGDLEEELIRVNDSWKMQEECMRVRLDNADDKLGLATQKVEEMTREISSLIKEKKKIEKVVETLTEENAGVRKSLNVAINELGDKQHEIDEAIRVKGETEEVKVNLESEIVDLRVKIKELEQSYRKFEEENSQLLSEVDNYKSTVEEVEVEKKNMKKEFEEEKKKVEKLELLTAKLQETVVKRDADLGQMRSDRDKLSENGKKLEGNMSVLRKENEALQSKLLEARKEVEDLSAKIDVWCKNWNKALALLKHTATLVSQQKDIEEEVIRNGKNVEEMEEIAVEEVEKIKKAFESKEEMLDEMKQKVVSLNKSVVDAHKSKNIWTVLSSATTIFAAALVAYVARGR
ncbi:myosin-13 [Vigna radiata var. radiata]|uniref:Myosin-13 n=1 Tax=Vigna radiata var. radiata TaxID=3916 RepID=A0A1S3UYA8_VIGRR|nr:myosin-13 [Vigna radiata var. radiata]